MLQRFESLFFFSKSSFFLRAQRGNVFAMLFAAVALTGVLASVGMQTLTGPVTTITRVTQKNIADTQLLMNAKIIVNAAVAGTLGGDTDSDGMIEPAEYVPAGGGETPPTNGGFLPTTLGLSLTDPWGSKYGYCVWDHGSTNTSTNRLTGDNTAGASTQVVIAVVSSGPDKLFQTSCSGYTSGPVIVAKTGGADDLIFKFTYAEASANSNGLWTLNTSDQTKAELKNSAGSAVNVTIDRDTGIGDFIGVTTGMLSAKTDSIAMAGGLKLDTDANVTACAAADKGTIRFNTTSLKVEMCTGAVWTNVGNDLWLQNGSDIYSNVTGKVGIGTNAPAEKLDVQGNAVVSGTAAVGGAASVAGNFVVNTDAFTVLAATKFVGIRKAAPTVALDVDGSFYLTGTATIVDDLIVDTSTLFVDVSADKVGIGTAAPTHLLDLVATTSMGALGSLNTNNAILRVQEGATGPNLYLDGNTVVSDQGFILGTVAAADVTIVADDTEVLRATATGNVGIGVPVPSAKLDVDGSTRIKSGSSLEFGGTAVSISGSSASDIMTFSTAGAERARIGATGNFGIADNNPSAKLSVGGGVKIGAHATCGAGENGTIQYNSALKVMQLCVDAAWKSVSSIDQLDDIGDVDAPSPAGNEVLAWDAGSSKWMAKPIGSLGAASINTAGTDGSIQFKNGSNLGADARLHWDNTAKRLGVGTATPTSDLDVLGPTAEALVSVRSTGDAAGVQLNANTTNAAEATLGAAAAANDYSDLAVAGDAVLRADRGNLVLTARNATGEVKIGTGATDTLKLIVTSGGSVGIGVASPDASALFELGSTTQGFLPPRMTGVERDAVSSPAAGLIVYNTTSNKLNIYDGSAWVEVGSGSGGGGSAPGTTMVAGWPDAVNCGATGNPSLYYLTYAPFTDTKFYYRNIWHGGDLSVIFKADKTYDSKTTGDTGCDGKSVSQLYTELRAFNFVGTGAGSAFITNVPDAIECGVSGTKRILYLQSTTATLYTYFASGDAGKGIEVEFDALPAGTHNATNVTGPWPNSTGCDGKTLAQLETEGRVFNLVGGGAGGGGGGSAAGSDGYIQFSTSGGFDAESVLFWDKADDQLGVGTATPDASAKIDISSTTLGFLPPRMTTAQRNAILTPATGLMIYNTSSGRMEYYDGTSWSSMSGATDSVPSPFDFTDLTAQVESTLVTSSILQIVGMNVAAPISITGQGSPEFRVCLTGDCSVVVTNWTSSSSMVNPGNYVQIRATTNAVNGGSHLVSVDIGTTTDDWNITTRDFIPDPFTFTDVTNQNHGVVIQSNIIQITGISAGSPATISGAGAEFQICSDAACTTVIRAYGTGAATVNNNEYIRLRLTSSANDNTMLSTTLTVGGVTDQWDVTTGDRTIAAVTFTDLTNQFLSTQLQSNIVQVTGITVPVPATVTGGAAEFRVCSDAACTTVVRAYSTASTNVSNNQYIQLRMTSSAADTTAVTTTFAMHTVSDVWSITTGDQTPNAFTFTDLTNQNAAQLITSGIIQISGLSMSSATSISGAGAEYRTCSDGTCTTVLQNWTTGAATISNNQYIQLRLVSSSAASTAVSTTMTIGPVTDNWSVTTGDSTPNAYVFTDLTNQNAAVLQTSNILQIAGLGVASPVTITNGEFRICADVSCTTVLVNWGSAASSITNNQYLQLRTTTNTASSGTVTVTPNVGGVTDAWVLTTGDATANAFNFTDQTLIQLSTLVNSNILQIAGLGVTAPTTISGTGAEFRVCSNATCTTEIRTWGTASHNVANGNYVQLRLTSSNLESTLMTATLNVNGVSDVWNVTTGDLTPAAFTFTDLTAQPISTLTQSNIVQITGLTMTAVASVTGGEFQVCSNVTCTTVVRAYGTANYNISNNQYVQLRHTTSGAQGANVNTVFTVSSINDNWQTTTGDTIPDAFTFTDQNPVGFSTLTSSNIVQITGITALTPGSAGGAEFQVCSNNTCSTVVRTWGTASHNFTNGQYVQLRATSSAAQTTPVNVTMTIGGIADTWTITTGDTVPAVFAFTDQNPVAISTLIYSDIIQITGISLPTSGTIAGAGANFQVCSDAACTTVVRAWGTAAHSFTNGQYVQLRTTSSAAQTTAVSATMTIGGVADSWNVITGDSIPNSIANAFPDLTNQNGSTLIQSDIVQITGITIPAAASVSAGEFRVCSDATCTTVIRAFSAAATTVSNNQYVQLRITSSGTAMTAVTMTVTVGTQADTWSVTTGDSTPNAFTNAFTDLTNQNAGVLVTSNTIQITGISVTAPTSITGAGSQYRICSDLACSIVDVDWGSAASGINNNQYIQLRTTTSTTSSGAINTVMTVGGVTDTWAVTTGDATAVAPTFTALTTQQFSTLVNSNIVQITGLGVTAPMTLSGAGSPEFRVCSDATCTTVVQNWGTAQYQVTNLQYVQLRMTTSAAQLTLQTATLNINGVTAAWNVTTGDTVPNAFTYTDLTLQQLSTLVTSNIVQITGITLPSALTITGGEYRVCSDAACTTVVQNWGSTGTNITNNQYVQLRTTTSASDSTATNVVLNIGGTSDTWVATTGDFTPVVAALTDQNPVAISTLTSSNIVLVNSLTMTVPISISGSGAEFQTCSNSTCTTVIRGWSTAATTIANNQYVQVRMTSSASQGTGVSTTLTVNNVTDTWTITTGDSIPDAFTFTDQNPVNYSTLTLSNIVQITGLTVISSGTISGGEFQVCSNVTCATVVRAWGTAAHSFTNGQYVQLRATSSAAQTTAVNSTLTIGGVSDTFTITTGDNIPNAFAFTDLTAQPLSTLVTSDIIQITGLTYQSASTFSGTGASFQVCSDAACASVVRAWGTAVHNFTNGQYVQLRTTTSASQSTNMTVTLTIAGVTDTWNATTGDSTPNAFTFADLTGQNAGVQQVSAITQITGITLPASATIAGTGTPQFQVCSDAACTTVVRAFSNAATTITNGQYVQLRNTTSTTTSGTVTSTLTIGGVVDTGGWILTTGDATATAITNAFTDLTLQQRSTLLESNIVQISGLAVTVPVTISSGEFQVCSDATCTTVVRAYSNAGYQLSNGQYIRIRLTSSSAISTAVTATLTLPNSITDTWSVTTGDDTPTALAFTDQTLLQLNTLTMSNIYQVTGLTMAAVTSISGVGGEFRVCTDAACTTVVRNWGTANYNLTNNQYVQLRNTTSASESTAVNTVLTVGTLADTWSITTGDFTPNAFTIPDLTAQAISTVINSSIVQITGLTMTVPISVSGSGAEFRTCSDAACTTQIRTWSTAATTIVNNNYVQVRLTSSASQTTAVTTVLTISAATDTWSVTTGDSIPDAFTFTDQNPVNYSTQTASNIVQINGLTMASNGTISGGGTPQFQVCSNVTCATVVRAWGNAAHSFTNGQYVQVRNTSSAAQTTAIDTTLTINGVADTFTITTGDNIPDAFSFTDLVAQPLSTLVTSNIVQITGLTYPSASTFSGTGASFQVCSDASCTTVVRAWGTAVHNFTNGQYVQLRTTTSASQVTDVPVTLTIGGVSNIWNVPTGDSTPAAFTFADLTNQNALVLQTSAITQITGLTMGAAATISGGEFQVCTDAACTTVVRAFSNAATTITNNQYVQLRNTTNTTTSGTVTSTLTIGGVVDTGGWILTTGDATANAMAFTDLTAQPFSTLTQSPALQITGLGVTAPATVTGGEFQVCSDAVCTTVLRAWGTTAYNIANNNYVLLRHTSSAAQTTLTSTTFTVNGVSDVWNVTTGDTVPAAFTVADLSIQPASTLVTSTPVQITGITLPTAVTISGGGGEFRLCTDAACASPITSWGTTSQNINNNQYLQLRLTTLLAANSTESTIPNIGGITDTWAVTTGDSAPNAFSFTDLTTQPLSTLVTSNVVQITGLGVTVPATISGAGAEFRVCSDAACTTVLRNWGTAAYQLTNGQRVQLRITTSGSNNTAVSAIMSVGTLSDTWSATTLP